MNLDHIRKRRSEVNPAKNSPTYCPICRKDHKNWTDFTVAGVVVSKCSCCKFEKTRTPKEKRP